MFNCKFALRLDMWTSTSQSVAGKGLVEDFEEKQKD